MAFWALPIPFEQWGTIRAINGERESQCLGRARLLFFGRCRYLPSTPLGVYWEAQLLQSGNFWRVSAIANAAALQKLYREIYTPHLIDRQKADLIWLISTPIELNRRALRSAARFLDFAIYIPTPLPMEVALQKSYPAGDSRAIR